MAEKPVQTRWVDCVQVVRNRGNTHEPIEVPMDEFRRQINKVPGGVSTVSIDQEIELKEKSRAFVIKIPKGAKMVSSGLIVLEPPTIDGEEVKKIGLGTKDAPNLFGKTEKVEKNQKFADRSGETLANDTDVYVVGLNQGGTPIDKSFTGGKVRVALAYETVTPFDDVE